MRRFQMRCYNGCWDSEAQAKFAAQDRLRKRMESLCPGARCTYFPMEEKFSVWVNYKQITGDHSTRTDALMEAISILENRHDCVTS